MDTPQVLSRLAALAFLAALAGAAEAKDGPSFDCAKAGNWAERRICSVPELAALDAEMAASYARARNLADADGAAALQQAQRRWIAGRAACEQRLDPTACLQQSYRQRLVELAPAATTRPATAGPAWTGRIEELLPAIDSCLAAVPLAHAAVTDVGDAVGGTVEVAFTGEAHHYLCRSRTDGRGLAMVADAEAPADAAEARFTRLPDTPATSACWRDEAVQGPAGAMLGWLSRRGC